MRIRNFLLPTLLVVFSLFLSGCVDTGNEYRGPTATPEPVVEGEEAAMRIGVLAPLSGGAASIGENIRQGVELAVKQANEAGKKVEVVFEDTQCKADVALNSYSKLAASDDIKYIVGAACSSSTLAIVPQIEGDGAILISPSSTSPDLTEAGKNFFRLAPSDRMQGRVGAEMVVSDGYKKVAVAYVNNDYGKALADVFTENFVKDENEVVITEAIAQDGSDFRSQLTKIKGAEAEAIYLVSYPKEAGVFVRQARELDLSLPILASEGVNDEEFLKNAGEASEGLKITVPYSSGSEQFTVYAEAFNTEYSKAPGIYSQEAYDAANLFINAVMSTSGDSEAVRNYLANVKNYAGASGLISFDENGDLMEKDYEALVVKDGKIVSEK